MSESATEDRLVTDEAVGRLLGRLATLLAAAFIAALAVRLVMAPGAGLGSNSPLVWMAILGMGTGLFLPGLASRWRAASLKAGLGFVATVLALYSLATAWMVGMHSLWKLPLVGLLLALLAASLELGEATAPPRFLGVTWPQRAVAAALVLFVAGTGFLAWSSPAGHPQEANLLLIGASTCLVTALVWFSALTDLRRGLACDRIRERIAIRVILFLPVVVAVVALLSPWLVLHSRQMHSSATTLAAMVGATLMAALLLFPAMRRRSPQVLLAGFLAWSAYAIHSHAGVFVVYLAYGSLILGLLLPARHGWLAAGLFALIVAAIAMAPGMDILPFITHGLAATMLFGLSLYLNLRLEAVASQGEPAGQSAEMAGQARPGVRIERLSLRAGLGTTLAVVMLGGGWLFGEYRVEQANTREKAGLEARFLAKQLAGKLAEAEHLGLHMARMPGELFSTQAGFERQASELLHLVGTGLTLEWAPHYVVRHIHPLQGNEKAVGLDLLADPDKGGDVREIIASGHGRWSGPFQLYQGGLAMVYRAPVLREKRASATAWMPEGLAIVLIRFPSALDDIIPARGHEIRVWVRNGLNPPVQVWGGASPGADIQDAQAGFARASLGRSLEGQDRASEGREYRAPPDNLEITVAVRTNTAPTGSGLLARLQALVIIAALLGWFARLLVRNRLQHTALRQLGVESEQMRGVLEQSLAGNVLFDAEGNVVWLNTQACNVFRATSEHVRHVNCFSHSLWQKLGWERQARATLDDGLDRSIEYQGPGTVGQGLDIRMKLSRVRIGGRNHLLLQVLDVSDVHDAQRALHEKSAELSTILANTGVGIAYVVDRRPVWANPRLAEMFGYALEELEFLTMRDFYPDEAAFERMGRDAYPVLFRGGKFARELEMRHRDGHLFWVRLTGKLVEGGDPAGGSIWAVEDIGDSRAAYVLAQHFQSLVASSGDAIVSKSLDGTITTWNRGAEHILGYGAGEIVGRSIYTLIPPGMQQEEEGILARIRSGQRVEAFETKRLAKDGRLLDVAVTVSPIVDSDGRVVAASKVLRDISERKRAEEALKNGRAFTQSILDSLPNHIAVLDPRGVIVAVNRAWQHFALENSPQPGELPAGTQVGANYLEVCARSVDQGEPMACACMDGLQALLAGRLETFELEYPCHSPDEERWFHMVAAPLRGAAGVVVIHANITTRVRLEHELREKTEQLDSILANTAVGVVHVRDRRIVWANPRTAELFGYSLDELRGMEARRLNPDDLSYRRFSQEVYATLAHGGAGTWERQMRHRDGNLFWCRLNARLIDQGHSEVGMIVVIEDVSARVEVERRLVDAVAAAEGATRVKSEFLSNMSHEIRTPLNGILGLLELLERTRLDDTQAGYVAKAYDTSRVLLNIINDVLDFSRIEAGRVKINRQPFALHREIQSVVDTLAMSAAHKALDLELDLEPGCPDWLMGDPLRLQQVLLNLGNNAIKFTDSGRVRLLISQSGSAQGFVTMRFEVRDTGIGIAAAELGRIFERFTQADAGATRRFGGTGLGLSIASGLVRAMGGEIGVESAPGQGSSFWFVLPFELAEPLPLEDMGAPLPSATDDRREGALAGMRVLLAEDQPINQMVMRDMLRILGAEMFLARNGEEAVAQVLAANGSAVDAACIGKGNPFDLVLMDVQMPVMDGLAATRILRQVHGLSDLPIIATTAGATIEEKDVCLQAGMNDFLAKPISINGLCATILRACGRAAVMSVGPAPLPAPDAAPDMTGFDVKGALANLGGDFNTYARLLRRFLVGLDDLRGNLAERLGDSTPEGNRAAAKLLHGLRGSALTLGAVSLAEVSRRAEEAVCAGEAPDRAELDGAFERVMAVFPVIAEGGGR